MYYKFRIDQIEKDNIYLLQKVNPDIYYAFYKWKLSLYHNQCQGESKEVIEENEKNIDNLLAICHLKKYIVFKYIDYYYIDNYKKNYKMKMMVLKELFSGTTIEMLEPGIGIYEISEKEVLKYIDDTTDEERAALIKAFTKFKLNKLEQKSDKIISLQQYKMKKN